MLRILAACALACAFVTAADARPRTSLAHERCNIDWPCEGVSASPRGERIAKAARFGTPQQRYMPRQSSVSPWMPEPSVGYTVGRAAATILPHPEGCPRRAFCGCGAALKVFGSPIRALWLARNWFGFPRAAPGAGMAEVRRHHVRIIEADLGGGRYQFYDANSGSGLTRRHVDVIRGTIVNPQGGSRWASAL